MNFTSSQLVRAAMTGRITAEELDLGLDVALRVERNIQCPISGFLLDSRTAVVVQVQADDGTWRTEAIAHPSVVEGPQWPSIAERLDAAGLTWRTATATDIFAKMKG